MKHTNIVTSEAVEILSCKCLLVVKWQSFQWTQVQVGENAVRAGGLKESKHCVNEADI